MRKSLFTTMLCIAMGAHFLAFASPSVLPKTGAFNYGTQKLRAKPLKANKHRAHCKKQKTECICGKLCVNGKLFVNGKPFDKQWIIPLSDNLDSQPPASALVYLNVEEAYNPVEKFGQREPVTLGETSEKTVTVTQIGDFVSIVLGSGEPINNLIWSQENDYSKMPNGVSLAIDFTGTEVEHLIINGANHTILTVPGGYTGAGETSKTGIAQIGTGDDPVVKIFPENAPYVSGIITLDETGSILVTDAILLALFTGDNFVTTTIMPGQAPNGIVYVSSIDDSGVVIQSTAGPDDAGLNVGFTITPNYNIWAFKGWPAGDNAIPYFTLFYTIQGN